MLICREFKLYSRKHPLRSTESDPVFQRLAETCTTRELAKYNGSFRAWRPMMLDKLMSATRTQDWYFPIRSKVTCSKEGGRHVHKRTWSGIHHPSLESHTLPHIPEIIVDAEMVARMDVPCVGNCPQYVATYHCEPILLAVAGGLMLFGAGGGGKYFHKGWEPLTVHNPLTNESRSSLKSKMTNAVMTYRWCGIYWT